MRLAAVTTAGEHVLPTVLASFRDQHPGIELGLEVGTREHVWGLLARTRPIWSSPAGHRARWRRASGPSARTCWSSSRRPVWPGDFDPGRTTWLMREEGSGTRETCEALLGALDADPPTLTLGSNGAVVAGAAAGLGVTLVSRDAVRGLLAAGEVAEVAVPQTPMRRPWHAVTYPRASAATEVMVAHLLAQGGPAERCWRQPAERRRSAVPSASRQAVVPAPADG